MFETLRPLAAIGCLLATPLIPTKALASEPIAVVLDVDGPTTPQIEAFEELSNGAEVKLDIGTRVWVSDYVTCAEYEVMGGKIRIDAGKIALSETTQVAVTDPGCIANVTLSNADVVSAGVVTRTSGSDLPKISARPSFGVAGPNAAKYEELSVVIGTETVFSAPLTNRRAEFPAGTAPLSIGKEAVVIVRGAGVQQRAVRVKLAPDGAAWIVLK